MQFPGKIRVIHLVRREGNLNDELEVSLKNVSSSPVWIDHLYYVDGWYPDGSKRVVSIPVGPKVSLGPGKKREFLALVPETELNGIYGFVIGYEGADGNVEVIQQYFELENNVPD